VKKFLAILGVILMMTATAGAMSRMIEMGARILE